jgi:hypothetical protein
MKRKSLILLLSLCSCTNLQYKGEVKGNERGAVNEIEIASDLSETFKLKSKVKKPHSYDWAISTLPDYVETGIEISF